MDDTHLMARRQRRDAPLAGGAASLAAGLLYAASLAGCGGSGSSPHAAGRLWYAGRALCSFTQAQLERSDQSNPAISITSDAAAAAFGDLALDGNGDVWAVDSAGDQILRFPASSLDGVESATPDLVIRSDAFHSPGNLVFDGDGGLWVANCPATEDARPCAGFILRFDAPGSLTGTQSLSPSLSLRSEAPDDLSGLGAIAFDASGNLWATSLAGAVRFEDPRSLSGDVALAPYAVIQNSGYTSPWSWSPQPANVSFFMIAFDSSGALWAAAQTTGFYLSSVMKFANPESLRGSSSPAPAAVIIGEPDLLPAGGMAFDPQGNLWLATADAILQYAEPGELTGEVNPTPAVTLGVFNECSPSLYGHLVLFPAPSR